MLKITKIETFQVDLPLHEGSYKWSGGNQVEVFDSTVVALHTDAGVTGYGEVCLLGRPTCRRMPGARARASPNLCLT